MVRKRVKAHGLSLATFVVFIQWAYSFPHIYALFRRYSKTEQDYLTVTEFRSFLNQQQVRLRFFIVSEGARALTHAAQGVRNPEPILRLYYLLSGGTTHERERKEAYEVFGEHLGVTREGTLTLFGYARRGALLGHRGR